MGIVQKWDYTALVNGFTLKYKKYGFYKSEYLCIYKRLDVKVGTEISE